MTIYDIAVLAVRRKDSIQNLIQIDLVGLCQIVENGLMKLGATQEELDAVKAEAEAEMDEAVKFADESPYPDPATVLDDMYVTDNERCVAR